MRTAVKVSFCPAVIAEMFLAEGVETKSRFKCAA